MRHLITYFYTVVLLFTLGCQIEPKHDVALNTPQDLPQAQFASEAIVKAVTEKGMFIEKESKQAIYLMTLDNEELITNNGFAVPSNLKKEGFSLQVKDHVIGVIGYDAAGLM